MSYTKFHTIIVSSHSKETIEEAREKAIHIIKHCYKKYAQIPKSVSKKLVSPIIPGLTNGLNSFFIAPNGSKEWLDEAIANEKVTDKFSSWLIKNDLHYVIVSFGGDDNSVEAY